MNNQYLYGLFAVLGSFIILQLINFFGIGLSMLVKSSNFNPQTNQFDNRKISLSEAKEYIKRNLLFVIGGSLIVGGSMIVKSYNDATLAIILAILAGIIFIYNYILENKIYSKVFHFNPYFYFLGITTGFMLGFGFILSFTGNSTFALLVGTDIGIAHGLTISRFKNAPLYYIILEIIMTSVGLIFILNYFK